MRPADAPRPKRPWTILGRLSQAVREQNWFAVVLEVLIVIVGVVVGFQVTAWGQARADRAREQVYLGQLAADLVETERIIGQVAFEIQPGERGATALVRAFQTPERPPRDSLVLWRRQSHFFGVPGPVMGTVDALVATGDLDVLRNDSLRSAVLAYKGSMDLMAETQRRMNEVLVAGILALDARIDYADVLEESMTRSVHDSLARAQPLLGMVSGERRSPFPFTVEGFLTDRAAYDAAQLQINGYRNLAGLRRDMLEATRALRDRVEAERNR